MMLSSSERLRVREKQLCERLRVASEVLKKGLSPQQLNELEWADGNHDGKATHKEAKKWVSRPDITAAADGAFRKADIGKAGINLWNTKPLK